MKLKKFKEENKKKKSIIIFTVCCILLIVGVFLYQSFALFETRENFNFIEGQVQDPGDLYFAYYVDDVLTYEMPSKDSGLTLSSKSSCTNGVTIEWDDEKWMAKVYYENYQKENNSRVKCTLYFEEKPTPPAVSSANKDYIKEKAPTDHILLDDETEDHNLRYIGKSPNNYIDIGDRDENGNLILWRIIGLMNNIKTNESDEVGETRLKIRKEVSVGDIQWASSDSTINKGYGVNEWSSSNMMTYLNNTFYNTLSDNVKMLIGDAVWHTGSNYGTDHSGSAATATQFYNFEHSEHGKSCTSSDYCNDGVKRTSIWTGKVGLVYPSDYGFASSLTSCKKQFLSAWDLSGYTGCKTNDWLYNSSANQWTMTPNADTDRASYVYHIRRSYTNGAGVVSTENASSTLDTTPVIYLKSNVKITSGSGSKQLPFIATLD